MTREETKKLLEVLRIAYPRTYRNMTPQDAKGTLELYYTRFKDYPTPLVIEALNAYIDENEYPPTISGIKKYLTHFSGDTDYDTMFAELWSGICGNTKFADMCRANQRYIGSQQVLDDMGRDEHTLYDVVRGQYMKRIGEIVASEKFDRSVEQLVGGDGLKALKTQAKMHSLTAKMLGDGNE